MKPSLIKRVTYCKLTEAFDAMSSRAVNARKGARHCKDVCYQPPIAAKLVHDGAQ